MSLRALQAVLIPVVLVSLFACKKAASPPAANPAKLYVIGIFQSVDSPTANEVRRGILKAFEDNGLREGESVQVRIRLAAGDLVEVQRIARSFVDEKVDLTLALTRLDDDVRAAGQDACRGAAVL